MVRLSRWFLGSALAWLLAAAFLGLLLLARPILVRAPALDALRPLAAHVLIMGFATQALFAILLGGSATTRLARRLGWACLLALDAGLALRVVSEPMLLFHALPPWGTLVLASAILEALAAIGLVTLAWPRRDAG